MKKRIRNSFSIFFCLLMIVSSAGIPLFAHTCHLSGHQQVSILPVSHSCCDTHEAPAPVSSINTHSCCHYDVSFLRANINEARQESAKKQLTSPAPAILAFFYAFVLQPAILEGNTSFNKNSFPDEALPYGRELLSLIQVLRS